MQISSSDPFANPIIDPGYLSSDFDIYAMEYGVRSSAKFLHSPALKGYIGEPLIDLELNSASDAKLKEYIRNNTVTVNHSCGTARMSPKGAKWGVVDPDLRVKGVKGLRVVDASIFVSIHGLTYAHAIYESLNVCF